MSEVDYLTPEAAARVEIDRMLELAGWVVQEPDRVNLAAAQGVAVREFILEPPHGRADYLLFVDGPARAALLVRRVSLTGPVLGAGRQSARAGYKDSSCL